MVLRNFVICFHWTLVVLCSHELHSFDRLDFKLFVYLKNRALLRFTNVISEAWVERLAIEKTDQLLFPLLNL